MRKEISNLSKGILFILLWTLSLSLFAQNITVRGIITDTTNEPLIGATIRIEGTSTGTVTDIDGNFTLPNISPNATLEVSYVGMIPQNVAVNGRTTINIVLQDDSEVLEEVVIVGYGTQRKESVVGSIVQTSSEDIKRTGGVTNLTQALTGQLPGVVTLTATGEPGGAGGGVNATEIFIRGRNTWNGGQPLILIDGVERSMDNIDINEVETISVLKDASATAVFGVKGANGVILIYTKRGSANTKPEMTLSYNATALMISRLPQKLDSYDTRRLKNEMIEREVSMNENSWPDYTPYEILNRYKRPQLPEYEEIYANVDWTEAMFKDVGMSHRTSFNLRGGTDFVDYFGSVAYLHEGDMFRDYDNGKGYEPNYNFDRFNFRTNLGFNLTKTTKLKVDLSGYYSIKNTNYSYRQENDGTNNPMVWAATYSMPPDVMLPMYSDGRWGASFKLPEENMSNPIALLYNTGMITYKTTAMNSNFSLEQKLDFITEGLSAEAFYFYDSYVQTTRQLHDGNHVRPLNGNLAAKVIYPERYTGPDQDPSEYTDYVPLVGSNKFDWVVNPWSLGGENMNNGSITRRMMYQTQLNYSRRFGNHNVGGLALFKREDYARGSMFKNYREDWVFRGTYDYDGRYLLDVNGAYNGSEKFGPGYRFDLFPSLGLGYYVSNEKFWKLDFMNRLKLKYTLGWVGDDNGGSRWAYSNQYAYGGEVRRMGMNTPNNTYSPYTWYKQTVIGNPDIHWEIAKKQNWGAEMGFFRDMISLNVDYFNEHRSNILVSNRRDTPSYFGATAPAANIGEVKAKGYEIELKFNHQFRDVFVWSNFSMTHSKNEIIRTDDPDLLPDYRKSAGYSIGQQRSLLREGFYNNWDEVLASTPTEVNDQYKMPGYYNIVDFNGDGVITSNGDTAPIGYPSVPLNTFNLTVGAEYKNFSLMLQFFGVNNVNLQMMQFNYQLFQNVLFDHALDYWSKNNINASSYLPRWKTWEQREQWQYYVGDYFMHDGSYLRLKTAELAYSFDKQLLEKAGLSSLRLFVNGNNLLFWSKLPDDRESYSRGGSSAEGTYPTPRRINFGLEVTF